jgi:hypothetical protein
MLEAARPEARARVRTHPRRFSWGIVDVILAAIMLPFGVWFFIVDRIVATVAALFDR